MWLNWIMMMMVVMMYALFVPAGKFSVSLSSQYTHNK